MNDVVRIDEKANDSAAIMQVIAQAANSPQCDIDKMERLLAMHERMQERGAEQAFNASMAQMQIELPSIAERGKGHGSIKYATFEDINDVVKPIMQKFGFALSFRVEHVKEGVNVTGILMHKDGHREQTAMLLPVDTSGSKNAVQAVGSSVSYGKRYVMCAMLNISTRGEDDDGYAAAPSSTITEHQSRTIHAILARCKPETVAGFKGVYGEPEDIAKSDYDKAMAQLNKAAKRDSEAV